MVKGECLWNLLNSFVWFYFYDGTHNSSELFRFKNEAEKPVTGREMRCKYIYVDYQQFVTFACC